MSRYVSTALGATLIVLGMTLGIKDKNIVGPAFLGGWGLIGYGLTDGFKCFDPLTTAGLVSVVAGGMMARAPMDYGVSPEIGKLGKPFFLGGWAVLAAGIAKETHTPVSVALASAGTVVAGAMLLRRKAFKAPQQPALLGPAVFGVGWASFVRAMNPA